ncbi:conserved hypothetical protein [Beutenbergia cavernae DSM 12333]|uniref:AMIN-like domain-containing protein n=1 Tax=Beutenbergia cavernae (strain ATCC BAA-8 / DSM 12333 / CCUG 43141 / JCM 11478 / NBRC 16432 / NCIMB 13614 / HKI 0122) TaxID=471853 RepID=C5C3F0_BEUC1|nr:hypothetical protein [Beutenbergia cavernae]ACQ79849.1 conserved hypothetical protein [Beutenbergia cavernae DSM 12333]
MRARAAVGAVALASLLALAACTGSPGEEDSPTDQPSSGPSATAEPSAEPSAPAPSGSGTATPDDPDASATGPAFPADTSPDTSDPSVEAALYPTAVRAGAHDGYDRVVVELTGTGTPGWLAEYVDSASSQGAGDPIDLDGDAILSVAISGSTYPDPDAGDYYDGPARLDVGTEQIEELVYDGIFEGVSLVFLGVDEEAPFRVFALENPTRVVIDVRDDD